MSRHNLKLGVVERLENTKPRVGAASTYLGTKLSILEVRLPCLFTDAEIRRAVKRAVVNPEDIHQKGSTLNRVLAWLKG